jgi:hypothetical protein
MKNLVQSFNLSLIILVTILVTSVSCEKVDDGRSKIPAVSFETAIISVNTEAGEYEAVLHLSEPAKEQLAVRLQFSGNAVENEHYTLESKEIQIAKGDFSGKLKIGILNENIWEENLEIKIVVAPGTDYVVLPDANTEIIIKLTKEIVLPLLSLDMGSLPASTNPFKEEELTYTIKLDQKLATPREVTLLFEGTMTIGQDFTINGGNSNKITFPANATETSFKLKIRKKDQAGFRSELKLTLTPSDTRFLAVSPDGGSHTIIVSDPLVDLTPILKTPALSGGAGYQIYQAIKGTDDSWVGRVVINSSQNTQKQNYLRTHRNQIFIAAFDCNSNLSGGDILRLSDMLNFGTTDTVIADYGAAKTTRFFSQSDSLIRFVAEEGTTNKGQITTVNQKFSAKLIRKEDWETGTNGNKQWHIDSKTTGGDISKSTYPTFATIEVELVKLEGTFDFTLAEPELIFDAWFKSTSPYFMRNYPTTLNVVKEGDLYKVTYRLYPR